MKRLPEGFQLHSGLDGLVIGLAIVFVVKVETVISSYIDWSQIIVVGRTIKSVKVSFRGMGQAVGSVGSEIGAHIVPQMGMGGSGATGGGGSGALPMVGEAASFMVGGTVKFIGFSVPLLGVGSASVVEKLLIILGVWIAILSPLYYWVIQPGMFWWREREPI